MLQKLSYTPKSHPTSPMDQRAAIVEVGKRIVPILQEWGIESAVVIGYIRTEDKLQRFVSANLKKDDAAQVDGLRQVVMFAAMWAGSPALGGAAEGQSGSIPPPDGLG